MATAAAILIQRFAPDPETGLQNVDVLVNDTVPNYWLWTVHNIDPALTNTQVQDILTANVAQYLAEIAANGEVPLSADQVALYQDFIDGAKLATNIDILQANILTFKVNGTVTGDPNVPTGGYKDVFKPTGTFGAMTNAVKFAVLQTCIFALLDAAIETMKVVILLARIQKRKISPNALSLR